MDPNISSQSQFGTQGTSSTSQTGSASTDEHLSTGFSTKDSITKAAEAVLANSITTASTPLLPPPSTDNDPKILSMSITLSEQQATINMLKAWNEGIAEQKKLSDQWYLSHQHQQALLEVSPQYLANQQFQTGLKTGVDPTVQIDSLSPLNFSDQARLQQENVIRALSNGIENYKQSINSGSSNMAEAIPFVAPTLVIGSTMIGQFTGAVPVSDLQVAFFKNTMSSFVQSVATIPPVLSPDLSNVAAILGGFFALGAVNYAELKTTVDSTTGKGVHNEQALARNYASKIIELASSGVLRNFILASAVDKIPGAEKMTETQKGDTASFVTVVILSTAIAALYKADTQWIKKEDFQALINQTMNFTPKTEKEKAVVGQLSQLAALLNEELGQLKKSNPKLEAKTRAALDEYIDSNPDFDGFFDVQSAVNRVSQTTPFQETKG